MKLKRLLTVSTLLLTTGCPDSSENEDTGASSEPDTSSANTSGVTGDPTDETETSGAPGDCADPNDPGARMGLNADIDGGMTLTCDTVWVLETIVFVRNGTLTIEPGTTILGTEGSALVIDATATIDARGRDDAPIVFTSIQPEGSRGRGDWGGLVLIGRAPNNLEGGVGSAEGFADPPSYGGTDPSHSCGALSYVRVEWAGFAIAEGSELNGITFYSCGTGTSVDHVQSHMGADDGIEMFGGGFDAKYLVITGAEDDSIDCDQGFTGNLQYVFIQQDPAIGDNILELSNQGADFLAEPRTAPTIANLTAIGSGAGGDKSKGLTVKEGTEARIYSSIIGNVTNELVFLQNVETQRVAERGGIELDGNVFWSHGGYAVDPEGDVAWTDLDFETWATTEAGTNVEGDPALASTLWGSPDPMPAAAPAGETAATPASSALDPTTYAGAVEPGGDDWPLAGWVNYAI